MPTANGGVSIASFASVVGTPVGIASTSFSFVFSITTGIVKIFWKQHEIRKAA